MDTKQKKLRRKKMKLFSHICRQETVDSDYVRDNKWKRVTKGTSEKMKL